MSVGDGPATPTAVRHGDAVLMPELRRARTEPLQGSRIASPPASAPRARTRSSSSSVSSTRSCSLTQSSQASTHFSTLSLNDSNNACGAASQSTAPVEGRSLINLCREGYYEQKDDARRMSSLISALGLVGLSTTALDDTLEAEEHDDEGVEPGSSRSRQNGHEGEGDDHLERIEMVYSSDGFQSAEEGDEGDWTARTARRASIEERLSRHGSTEWSSLPPSPARATVNSSTVDAKVLCMALPSKLHSSPLVDNHRPTSPTRTYSKEETDRSLPATPELVEASPESSTTPLTEPPPEEADLTEKFETPALGTVSPDMQASTPQDEEDLEDSSPTSVRQLVQQSKRLARASSREFTAADERRLSQRKMERARDGLGFSLEIFEPEPAVAEGQEEVMLGQQSLHLPPLLSSTSATGDDQPVTFQSGAIPSYAPLPLENPTAFDLHSPATNGRRPSNPLPPLPFGANSFPVAAVDQDDDSSPSLLLATTFESPILTSPASGGRRRSKLTRPQTASGDSSHRTSPTIESFHPPLVRDKRSPGLAEKTVQRRASLDDALKSPDIAARSRQTLDSADLSQPKPSRRLSNLFARLTPSTSRSNDSGKRLSSNVNSGVISPIPSSSPALKTRPTLAPAAPISRTASGTSLSLGKTVATPTIRHNSSPGALSTPATISPGSTIRTDSPSLVSSPFPSRTWRSTMSSEEYDELQQRYGAIEMKRQEVIWELTETEKSFVEALKGVMEVFALPLRDRRGGWIRGVPVAVSRLFDWAADIVYLHSQIASALIKARGRHSSRVVTSLARVFAPYIAQLEMHQPYLVRFEVVTRIIERLIADPASDFGAFVRMQSRQFLAGMSLSSYLLRPVQRLMKYPLFFKQLVDLTPETHVDHANIVALLRDTDLIIRVMQEVKTREDEHEEAKKLEAKMQGLPEGFRLARRDRRLLAHGPMRRVHVNDKDRQALLDNGPNRPRQGSLSTLQDAIRDDASEPLLPPVLISPWLGTRPLSNVSDSGSEAPSSQSGLDRRSWPSPTTTPDATTPVNSTTPLNSTPNSKSSMDTDAPRPISSVSTNDSGSSESNNVADEMHQSHQIPAASASLLKASFPSLATSTSSQTSARRSKVIKTRAKESSLHVFVYSDVVVFASRSLASNGSSSKLGIKTASDKTASPKQARPEYTYRVLDSIGVSRLFEVADLTTRTEHAYLLYMDLMPYSAESTPSAKSPRSIPIFLTLPTSGATTIARTRWLEAFHESRRTSSQFLWSASGTSIDTPVTNDERVAVATSAGTMSPGHNYSSRLPAAEVDATTTEREEREWWALRFKMVKNEFEGRSDAQRGIPA